MNDNIQKEYKNLQRKENYKRGDFSTEPKRRWLRKEVEYIYTFDGTDRELAKNIKRSVQAIQVKRCKTNNNYENNGEKYGN